MPFAHSPRYPALYDVESGVTFSHGRAEVTDEQARALAKRRFTDGILIDEVPAKKWVASQANVESAAPEGVVEGAVDAPPLPTDAPRGSKRTRSE